MARQLKTIEAPRVNAELVKLTYGALVVQMVQDFEDPEETNKQLDHVGYNLGVRLVEDFIAHHSTSRCYDMRQVAEKLQAAFKLYLGTPPTIGNWTAGSDCFSLIWQDANPLGDFVELGPEHEGLDYARILCGCIRGALEMVQFGVEVQCVKDHIRNDTRTEFKVQFLRKLDDALPAGEDY